MAYAELGEVFCMIVIDGPAELRGELKVQGAKNSTLPLLAATVLCRGQTVLHNCPGSRTWRLPCKFWSILAVAATGRETAWWWIIP